MFSSIIAKQTDSIQWWRHEHYRKSVVPRGGEGEASSKNFSSFTACEAVNRLETKFIVKNQGIFLYPPPGHGYGRGLDHSTEVEEIINFIGNSATNFPPQELPSSQQTSLPPTKVYLAL